MSRTIRRHKALTAAVLAAVFITSWCAVAASVAYEFVLYSGAARQPAGARTVEFRQRSQTRYVTERQAAWRDVLARAGEAGGTLGLLSVVLILVTHRDHFPRTGDAEPGAAPGGVGPPAPSRAPDCAKIERS